MPFIDKNKLTIRQMEAGEESLVYDMLKTSLLAVENRVLVHTLTRPCSLLFLAFLTSLLRLLSLASFLVSLLGPLLSLAVLIKAVLRCWPARWGPHRPAGGGAGQLYVAVTGELPDTEICGFLAVKPLPDGETLSISRLTVSPWHQRAGIATAVLGWAETWARKSGLTRVTLSAFPFARATLALCQRNGYKASARVTGCCTVLCEYRKDL